MTTADWHAHAQDVDPTPTLSLLPPLTDLVVGDEPAAPARQVDTDEAVLAAQVADEIAVLTRVLLGLGLPDPEPASVQPVLVEPFAAFVDDDGVFVAPPIVEIEPLVAVVPAIDAMPEPEPVAPEPHRAPVRDAQAILDELAFLDR